MQISDMTNAALSGKQLASHLGRTRRDFLRDVSGLTLGSALSTYGRLASAQALQTRKRKVIVVTFGGGARDQETFAPEGQHNIPHMLQELAPQSTFCTHVTNGGILGHYVATASLTTGVYESINNFSVVPPENPTVFEYYRKDLKQPQSKAWVVAPSNGFNRIGESRNGLYGPGFGGGVILPKQLLEAVSKGDKREYSHLLQDNYENPLETPKTAGEPELKQLDRILRLSVNDFTAHARTVSSPDELSLYIAKRLMREESPNLLWLTLHDIDIAHSGAYSLYVDAIRRTDRLCGELWRAVQDDPEYKGNTTMLILPDFGRDADTDAGANGFQHHRTGGAASRTTWMMALGAGVREGRVCDRAVSSVDLVPTLGAMMGFNPKFSQGRVIPELL